MAGADQPDYHCLIVGAGFSGIGVAIKLDDEGFHDYLIVEAANDVGGTWYWNTYPGIAVDIPSFSYQFSFEQRPDWSRTYARGNELKAYADYCADKYGIRPKIRFRTQVVSVEFDEERALWRVQTDPGGEVTARFVVNASGVLTVPKPPDIDGVDSFAGITMHTARWDHTADLAGKRVAVIGTGASAVQLIPKLAPIVKELTVFQRTPIWCFPKFDVPLPRLAHWAMRLPGVSDLHRLISQAYVEVTFPIPAQYFTVYPFARWMQPLGRAYLRLKVRDPAVRAQLTPNYAIGCKRPGFHNSYLSTYNRDNVRLVTEPIDKITASAVATTGGAEHEADVLILATGFQVFDSDSMPTFAVTGRGGVALKKFWDENRAQAYEGVSVPGFPNLFSVMGPYGYVGSSFFALIEAQTRHIVRCLKRARTDDANWVEVTDAANTRYFEEVLSRRHRQVFWQDSCRAANSYYFDKNGDVGLRPATTFEVYWRSKRFDLDDYQFTG
jgi:cation diffusion facilitator CzcD-associated flavoprotein CzcO